MNRVCFSQNPTKRKRSHKRSEQNLHEQNQHASSIQPLKNNFAQMKKRTTLYAVIFLFMAIVPLSVFSQPYKTGIGARLGGFSGFTVKHFVNNKNAIEGLLTFRWRGTVITGLYEWQNPISGAPNLDWEIGLGGHIGIFNDSYTYYDHHYDSETVVGIDFIIGLEYTFTDAPFSIGLDWKPAINFTSDGGWWGDGIGLSVRYNFK
jgi:hypothetical protein